ncbi:peptidase M29 [Pandoraea morbifera]|uniref:Peptidase M29 n=1 Tax=Pandoraea morbifera TaxID=2508300 RepID=A0A5E4UUQ6_9BURK|nr:peptidase M29 [Pandoraea morbifera]VVE03214.1 peptidase M29 [Pandoraea morbifera]
MLIERIEHKWIDVFAETLRRCDIRPGDVVAIVAETQSRPVNVELAQLAAESLGARPFRLVVPSPRLSAPVPVRSTGASDALGRLAPVVAALKAARLVVDCTVEGLLHAPELPEILGGGARVLMVSNEHPEILERCATDPALEPKVRAAIKRLRGAEQMHVRSGAGTDLRVSLRDARVGGVWGWCAKPGQVAHWPGGLALAFPAAHSVNGQLVLAPGDINLTFKQYVRDRIVLSIEDDYVVAIDGEGVDVDLMRDYFAAWGDREAYAVSHVGFGLNPRARWDALACYDKRDCNGTEQRAFAGNFLYSTGANEVAGRHTLGHFDLPLRHCTIALDGDVVVRDGQLQGEFAA